MGGFVDGKKLEISVNLFFWFPSLVFQDLLTKTFYMP